MATTEALTGDVAGSAAPPILTRHLEDEHSLKHFDPGQYTAKSAYDPGIIPSSLGNMCEFVGPKKINAFFFLWLAVAQFIADV